MQEKVNLVIRYRRGQPRETVHPVEVGSLEYYALVAEASADRKVASIRLETSAGEVPLFERS